MQRIRTIQRRLSNRLRFITTRNLKLRHGLNTTGNTRSVITHNLAHVVGRRRMRTHLVLVTHGANGRRGSSRHDRPRRHMRTNTHHGTHNGNPRRVRRIRQILSHHAVAGSKRNASRARQSSRINQSHRHSRTNGRTRTRRHRNGTTQVRRTNGGTLMRMVSRSARNRHRRRQ